MCDRVEYIAQVDPDGWYAPVIGQELIRCKDCKWYVTNYLQMEMNDRIDDSVATCQNLNGADDVDENGFCCWAERKEE